jgi:predicted DNA-binding antitoxin AbrB/MazE fold protein
MDIQGDISVTYTGGVLRPDEHLDLPEGTRLRAALRPEAPDAGVAAKAMDEIRRLSESGIYRSGGKKLTRDQMHERN